MVADSNTVPKIDFSNITVKSRSDKVVKVKLLFLNTVSVRSIPEKFEYGNAALVRSE